MSDTETALFVSERNRVQDQARNQDGEGHLPDQADA
jgi:hypothetical protein